MIKEIITRAQARNKNLSRYYTNNPCPRGHFSERRTSNGQCVACCKERLAIYSKTEKGEIKRAGQVARRVSPYLQFAPEHLLIKPNKCELCRKTDIQIVLDHCHKSQLFRGWVCTLCNKALGCVYDDVKTLENMISYLNRHQKSIDSVPVQFHSGGYEPEVFGYG